jgi:DNA-binding beta-propeller fold protein YncE
MISFRKTFLLLAGLIPSTVFADGPGLGNLNYTANEHLSEIARFDIANGIPEGLGFVSMHRGWLFMAFSHDGGGGNGTGGFAFFDVSNPRQPINTFTTHGKAAYTNSSSPNYAGDIREAHAYSFSGDILCIPTNRGQGTGLQFWDFSQIDLPNPAPVRLSRISLPGLTGGDYAPTPWWVFWQGGRYAYVAGTSGGIYIVDASNPSQPVLADRGPGMPNPIPISQTGGFNVNTIFAIGNLLVISASDAKGISTLDISDPLHPVLIQTRFDYEVGYSMMVNGNRILAAHSPARIYDISNPANITLIGSGPAIAAKGGYGTFQDGIFHYGSSDRYVKLNIAQSPFTVMGTSTPAGTNADWDFGTALGNLILVGNDHAGSVLVPHDRLPDTLGPEVNMVNPPADAVSQAVTSRVGITLSDQIDTRTINTTNFIVRPLGGSAIPGRFSNQTGIVNFWPDTPFQANSTYEIHLPAGGIKDFAGNGLRQSFTSRFSTGAILGTDPIVLTEIPSSPTTPGVAGNFSANGSTESGTLLYSWEFGDGSAATSPSSTPAISHSYSSPGHYSVKVVATNGTSTAQRVFTHTVHWPLTTLAPVSSSPIAHDPSRNRVWNVNPDTRSVTAIDGSNLSPLFEITVGNNPRSLARAPDGNIFVAVKEDAKLVSLHPDTGAIQQTVALPRGSRPAGVLFAPDGSAGFVTLEATGKLLRFNPASGAITGTLSVGPTPRGIAIDASSESLFVTRFISPDENGVITKIDLTTWTVSGTIPLAFDPGPDDEDAGRGVPNYVQSITISPDGRSARIPSKKDNIARGLQLDGLPLNFENTVRTIVSEIDLQSDTENLASRIDLNDRDMANAVAFSPLGDYIFVTTQGTNSVDVFDAYTGFLATSIENIGLAPQGLVITPDGSRLFVHNFMSRTVSVHDISGIVTSTSYLAPTLGMIPAISTELLTPTVLTGKKLFYNARDGRMNQDSYLSCASCHLDGGHDGRTWDFSDRGEGFRNTIDLTGRAGGQGLLHWSANFDEVQDFEHDIRGPFGGSGFMQKIHFEAGTVGQPLGDPKAGLSAELDALAAYLGSLDTTPPSPHRQQDGSLTVDAVAGRAIFIAQSCHACHSGPDLTDSAFMALHDVGTLKETSGGRLGGVLAGIDTPTLKGIWDTAPYLHDGSAPTVIDVLNSTNDYHGETASLTNLEKQQLAAYLLQLEDSDEAPDPGPLATMTSPPPGSGFIRGSSVPIAVGFSDFAPTIDRVQFFADEIMIDEVFTSPYQINQVFAEAGSYSLTARVIFAGGSSTATFPVPVNVTRTGGATQTIAINFQPTGTPVPTGWHADTGLAFGNRGNGWSYGWNTVNDATRVRNNLLSPSLQHDTFNHMQRAPAVDASWEIAVPNGTYTVRIVSGDADFFDGAFRIAAENVLVVNGNPASGSRWVEGIAEVEVNDGRLTLTNAPGASGNKICHIEITRTLVTIPINFQPVGTPVPPGWLADTGLQFGVRGYDWSYGWNTANDATRVRNNPLSPTPQHDTFNHMQRAPASNAFWEIELPNGPYHVRIVSGDADYFDGTFRIDAEGVRVINSSPTTNSRWVEGAADVEVQDGRLTISNATGASGNKICLVEITSENTSLLSSEFGTLATVSIAAPIPGTTERAGPPAAFRLIRDGSLTSPLTVHISVSGTARKGVDYNPIETSHTFPPGISSLDIPVTPLTDGLVEGQETVMVALIPDERYTLSDPSHVTLTIDDPPYQNWASRFLPRKQRNDASINAPLADPNSNGQANLLEYAFGFDPLQPTPTLPYWVEMGADKHLILSFRIDPQATDLTWQVEASDDFIDWRTDEVELLPGYQENSDGTRTYQARDLISTSSSDRRFLRLRVGQLDD